MCCLVSIPYRKYKKLVFLFTTTLGKLFPSLIGSIKRNWEKSYVTFSIVVSIPYRKYKKYILPRFDIDDIGVSIPYRKYKKLPYVHKMHRRYPRFHPL